MLLDLSDVGVTVDVDALAFADGGASVLVSFDADIADFPGPLSAVDDSDLLKFTPNSWGLATAGPAFTLYFDGSDVGLTTSGEDVDAVHLLPDGRLIISTLGAFGVPGGLSGNDEDLLIFTPASLDANTNGTWAFYFDGSAVDLTVKSEDIWGLWAASATGPLYLSTIGDFAVPELNGDNNDLFACTPAALGVSTSCSYTPFWDGGAVGYGAEQIDAVAMGDGSPALPNTALVQAAAGESGSTADGLLDEEQDDIDDTHAPADEAQTQRLFLPLILSSTP